MHPEYISIDRQHLFWYLKPAMILNILQIIFAVLLTAAILIQQKGAGLGAAFGGDGNVYRTKRGIEQKLHTATIVLAILFFGISLANVLFEF